MAAIDPDKNWIRLNRSLLVNEMWLNEPFTRGQAWVDLLMLANHKPGGIRRRGIKVNVQRGEVGMSLRELADRWKWSLGKIQRYFDELKKDAQVSHRADTENVSVTTLIYLMNYEKYQPSDTETDTETGTKTGTETDTETGTEQEGKEVKKVKKNKKEDIGDKSPSPSLLFNLWNDVVKEPRAITMNKTRIAKCRSRLKERSSEEWRSIFEVLVRTPFLRGQNDRGWRADFDWIISNDINSVKILEGKYGSRADIHEPSKPIDPIKQKQLAAIKRMAAESDARSGPDDDY